MDYFMDYESKYFDDELSRPITSKPVPEKENAPPGTDPGGFLTSKIVGITSDPTKNQVEALQASIRSGSSKIELGFMGTQKGTGQAPTPESMSREDRENIYNLARLNDIETTVHATPQVSNLSGFNPQQGTFGDSEREEALNEIRRAVDFAADASTGGAVVVHWDEWQRPIESAYGLENGKNNGGRFKGYENEFQSKKDESGYGKAPVLFVNTEDDKVLSLRRDTEFFEPLIESVNLEKDADGIGYLNINYKKDETNNEIVTQKMHYDDIVQHEIDLNTKDQFRDYKEFTKSYLEPLNEKWKDIEKMPEDTELDKLKKKDAIYLYHFIRKEADKSYEQFLSSDSYYKHYQNYGDQRVNAENKQRRDMAWAAFQQQLSKVSTIKPLEDYTTERASETVAEAAMYAWERSQGNQKLSRNIYIAPEAVFPQSYGAHPDEMVEMIDESRDKMAEHLAKTGKFKSKDDAKKEAEKYIRATLDVGHLNMWRRHLKRKENESDEEFNKRFNKWALEKSEDMAKKGYIGHAHMSDNFGFGDEHLTVGQGNAPIKEFVEALRKTGNVDDFIVEVGSYNALTAQKDAWSHLGIGMGTGEYFRGKSARSPGYFSGVRDSYAGQTRKPSYVFGNYVPKIGSEKWQGWSPWSGSPL